MKTGNEPRTSYAVRGWLRQQMIGDTAFSLDRPSLLFGSLFLVSMQIAVILAVILGCGTAAILAALTAMLVLIAAFGGPLRSDLRLLAWFGPVFILAVDGSHGLASLSPWGTIPVIVLIVFLAGLLPAYSTRYATVGLALVLGVLIGFGI